MANSYLIICYLKLSLLKLVSVDRFVISSFLYQKRYVLHTITKLFGYNMTTAVYGRISQLVEFAKCTRRLLSVRLKGCKSLIRLPDCGTIKNAIHFSHSMHTVPNTLPLTHLDRVNSHSSLVPNGNNGFRKKENKNGSLP